LKPKKGEDIIHTLDLEKKKQPPKTDPTNPHPW